MKNIRLIITAVGFLGLLILKSCDGYLDQFNMDKLSTDMVLNPSFVAPIAYGSFSIQDIFETLTDSSGLVSLTEDSLILISFSDAAYSLDAGNLIVIPDHVGAETYFKSDIEVPDWFDPGITEYVYPKVEKVDFAMEPGDKIDSLFIKSGNIVFDLRSDFRHDGEVTISSRNLIKPNGDSLYMELPISEIDGNYSNDTILDLSGYKMILDSSSDSAIVKFNVILSLTKSSNGILDTESASITASFRDVKYSSLYGYIAEREVTDLEQSIDLDFFNSLDNIPEIYFADPQINLYINNSFGVPLKLDVNTFKARSSIDGTFFDLEFLDNTINPFVVEAPSVPGESILSTLSYNVESTNIDNFIASLPDKIDFKVSASTGNPPGSTDKNFLLDTSKVDLKVEVLLPMWFSTTGYTLRDTLDMDISELTAQLEMIKNLTVELRTINEWPLELALQLYFLDNENVVVDSLFQGKTAVIAGAPVNGDGELIRSEPVENLVPLTIEEENLQNLDRATKLMLVATILTSDGGNTPVKFYTSYLLNYKVSILAEFKIDPTELNIN